MSDKRQDILDSTLDLVLEYGLESTSMKKIMGKAGVGAGTIYNYFSSKKELLNILYWELREEVAEYLDFEITDEVTIEEHFKSFWGRMLSYYLQYPEKSRYMETLIHSQYLTEKYIKVRDKAFMTLSQIVQIGKSRNNIKEMPSGLIFHICLGIITKTVRGNFAGKFKLDSNVQKLVIEACWDAVKE